MSDRALWPGNYPAGHYVPLFVMCAPLLACMIFCAWRAIRATHADRKERTMYLGPLAPPPEVVYQRSTDHQRAFFANGACSHFGAERVLTVNGEHVGWVCPACDAVLQPDRRDWPVPELPPYVPDPHLVRRIQE